MSLSKRVDLSNIAAGLVIATIAAIGGRFILVGDSVTALQAQSELVPDRRDRELDQLIARVSALEERCRGE